MLYPLDAIESTLVDSRAHPVAAAADRLAESALLQQIARGDRAAVWQLWHRHRAYLYRRCLHWTDHPSDADEALSRAGLRAWEKLPRYAEGIESPRRWLTRLTQRVCLDLHRERQRAAVPVADLDGVAADGSSGCEELPEARILRQELGTYLAGAIAALSPPLREPFVLRCCDELPYEDVAQRLKLTRANARKRVQQARAHLQRQLHPYLHERARKPERPGRRARPVAR